MEYVFEQGKEFFPTGKVLFYVSLASGEYYSHITDILHEGARIPSESLEELANVFGGQSDIVFLGNASDETEAASLISAGWMQYRNQYEIKAAKQALYLRMPPVDRINFLAVMVDAYTRIWEDRTAASRALFANIIYLGETLNHDIPWLGEDVVAQMLEAVKRNDLRALQNYFPD